MTTYFDASRKRLIQCSSRAGSEFWDQHWRNASSQARVPGVDHEILRLTLRHLPRGSRVLEGGCGMGGGVRALRKAGFDAIGVDYAPNTVKLLIEREPDLCFQLGDVRRLDFPDESFDGYWSLGVIEHFYEGYGPILSEIRRTLRPGGLLVLTFPHMSPLRKIKARMGAYPALPKDFSSESQGFYQFLLDAAQVEADLRANGFQIISQSSSSGLKGLKNEAPALAANALHFLYCLKSPPGRIFKAAAEVCLRSWCGHIALLAARKCDENGNL